MYHLLPPEYSNQITCDTKGLWSGVNLLNKDNDTPSYAQCKDHYLSDNTCDCQMVDLSSNKDKLVCPSNKYIKTYYPLANKALCCNICDSYKDISHTDENSCVSIYKDNNGVMSCPNNKFVKDMYITKDAPGSRINCCNAEFINRRYRTAEQIPVPIQSTTTSIQFREWGPVLFVIVLLILLYIFLKDNILLILIGVAVLLILKVDVLGLLQLLVNWILSFLGFVTRI